MKLVRSLAILTITSCILIAAEPIIIDGSSTVYPITVALAEVYAKTSGTQLQVGVSGTTGGMRLFTAGKIPITGASRPIRPDELKIAEDNGIAVIEIPIAIDGLTVVVGKVNQFINHLTTAELKRLWEPESQIKTWADLRQGWPAQPVELFGPGRDSGTFDYFTEVIVGKARSIRDDFTASEDDNDLVQNVVSNTHALSYFGWAYYQQNNQTLRALSIDSGHGPVEPTRAHILDGTYTPLSRPLFFYADAKALDRAEVRGFLETALDAPRIIEEAGYVALDAAHYAAARKRLADRTTGTVFAGVPIATAFAALVSDLPQPVPLAKITPPLDPIVPQARPEPIPVPAQVQTPNPTAAPLTAESQVAKSDTSVSPLERLRSASLALTRASLEREPDPVTIRRWADEVHAASAALAPVVRP